MLAAKAREAYFRGDFSAIIAITDDIAANTDERAVEARLLRTRALLKLLRPADVLAELREPDIAAIGDVDARCTGYMLRGAAVARLDAVRGAKELAAVSLRARALRAHSAVQAEIAFFRALAHWSAGELDLAETHARAAERSGRDVLAVRAMDLRAYIASAQWRYAEALELFRAAARAYGRCRERDVDLATKIADQIASLEQTLRGSTERGTHRGRKLPGTAFGPAVVTPERLRLAYNDAWLHALDGDRDRAFRSAREAGDLARRLESRPWDVWALANRAAIAAAFNEYGAALSFVEAGEEIAVSVNWNETRDEQRLALLQVAEVRARVAPATALIALRRYDDVTAPMDQTRVLRDRHGDARMLGWDLFVRGLVLRAEGHADVAAARFTDAAQAFHVSGYLWRQAHALIELGTTTGGTVPLDRALDIVRTNFPSSFLAHRFGAWARVSVDPIGTALTPAQREVLSLLLEGHTGPEIASLTARSYNTVRQHVQALHRAFGTHAEHQLVVACVKLGIGAPSWASELVAEPEGVVAEAI
jgi:DNA-binding CsgD family transcriptional regulator/tetratricopeptide (TPR) repeat protein